MLPLHAFGAVHVFYVMCVDLCCNQMHLTDDVLYLGFCGLDLEGKIKEKMGLFRFHHITAYYGLV